jgi:uncharacterized protein (TIGR02466 family)
MPTPSSSPIASNEVLALFPTVVCRIQIEAESHQALNRAINARVDALTAAEKPLARGERLRTGTDLHLLEEFAPLSDFVISNAEGMLSYMMAVHGGIEITACWADVRGPGARLSDEAGSNAYLSAMYISRLPEGEARVSFRDPRMQAGILSLSGDAEGSKHSEVSVREGTLLLFPAWLEYGMAHNPGDTPSVSIGFSLMFGNFTEAMSKPLWQGNTYKQA